MPEPMDVVEFGSEVAADAVGFPGGDPAAEVDPDVEVIFFLRMHREAMAPPVSRIISSLMGI